MRVFDWLTGRWRPGCWLLVAKTVDELAPPTEDELRVLRHEIDPTGIMIRGDEDAGRPLRAEPEHAPMTTPDWGNRV